MTRFTRAEGSKSSNKRSCEESTPWSDLKFKKSEKQKNESDVEGNFKFEKCNAVETDTKDETNKIGKKQKTNHSDKQEKEVGFITENGLRYKQFKDGKKKPWVNISYEESDFMTKYNRFFVKKDAVDELNKYKESLEKELLDAKLIKTKMMTKERRAHKKLRVELMYQQIRPKKLSNDNKNENVMISESQTAIKPTYLSSGNFVESETIARYEDYWVGRRSVGHLNRIKDWKTDRIISERKDGNSHPELTEEESRLLNRQMKKEKRREHHLLCNLIKTGELESTSNYNEEDNTNFEHTYRKQENVNIKNNIDTKVKGRKKIVKFDGYSVTEDSAKRLYALKDDLSKNNISKNEVDEVIKLERRKEERDLKKIRKLICFNCREPGHTVAQCQQTKVVEICFKCGSTEHMSKHCFKQDTYDHAQCFHCKKIGHLARECPDNPNGMYPNGGSCRECGSVAHLARNCPSKQEQNAANCYTLKVRKLGDNPEDMEF